MINAIQFELQQTLKNNNGPCLLDNKIPLLLFVSFVFPCKYMLVQEGQPNVHVIKFVVVD